MSTRWLSERRDGLVVAGEGAATYLHSQLAQEVRDVAVGESRWTLVLEPNGHVTALARLWRRAEDEFVLDTEAGFGEVLHERLARFMIRVKATIEPAVIEAVTPVRDLRPDDPDAETPEVGAPPRESAGSVVGWWGLGGVLLSLGRDAAGEDARAGERDSGEGADLLAARVGAGWPAMGAEIVPGERLPAELGIATAAVSFTKGCYPGQELVERMDSRGAQAPRRLCRLAVRPGAAAGDPVLDADANEVGTLTSVAGTDALGFVKRGVDLGSPVTAPN